MGAMQDENVSLLLLFSWLGFLEIQALIDVGDINPCIDAVDLNDLTGTVMAIVPDIAVLIVALPYFYIWRELAYQHYFMYRWTCLVGFELHAAVTSLSTG